jgi:CarD family transcriptional regulator
MLRLVSREVAVFKVGEKVVYPHHGAGIIECVEEKQVLGEMKTYFIVRLSQGQLTVMVPADSISDVGLRRVISLDEAESVLAVLSDDQTKMPKDWNRRFKKNREKIKSGDIFEVAEVVRNLTIRDLEVGLSTGEKRMLNRARQILVSELVFAFDADEDHVNNMVDGIFH